MTKPMDEIMLTRLSALLVDVAGLKLSEEEHRAVEIARLRAESGNLSYQQQFWEASEFFDLEIVQALQEQVEQVIGAIAWFANPGPDRQERLQTLSRFIKMLLGFDFLTFCYLLHVARVASLLREACAPSSKRRFSESQGAIKGNRHER